MEFNEYATEVDIEFVRKAVRSIGRCAIKLEEAAERCVNVLVALIKTKVNYVVQEAIVVIRNIFRKYPNKYEGVIGTLCENLDTLDESEAKAAMIWIVGTLKTPHPPNPCILHPGSQIFDALNPKHRSRCPILQSLHPAP
jgi:AP-1 complex subunit beta-1